MRINNYLSVCMFQLKVQLDCNSQNEYIFETGEVLNKIQSAFQISDIYLNNPRDITVKDL